VKSSEQELWAKKMMQSQVASAPTCAIMSANNRQMTPWNGEGEMNSQPDFSFDQDSVWEVSWQFEGEEFEILRSLSNELSYRARSNVFKQGDAADGMYLVLDGYALVIATDEAGAERTVGITMPGQSFGELGLLVDQPRMATVSAGTDLRVLKITPESLSALEQREPSIASMMYKRLARTLASQLIVQGNLLGEGEK
jgi:hypothetical protein